MKSSRSTGNTPFAVLSSEEYVHFCDLIICGAEMAQYLIKCKRTSRLMRRHAKYWQKIVQNFKPLLKEQTRHVEADLYRQEEDIFTLD